MPFFPKLLQTAVQNGQQRMLDHLRSLVEIESPSEDAAAVNCAMDTVAAWAKEIGGEIVRSPQAGFGDIVECHFTPADLSAADRKPLLLLGHLDTVWPLGTLERMPWREQQDTQGRMRLWGPGVLDMKAGVLMALEAIAAVQQCGGLSRPVVLLLNPDEEVGSTVSRSHTERLARLCEAVFVMEPAQGLPGTPDGAAYKTARKGIGRYRLEVRGVASHAGVDFTRGHSAVLELARLLPKIAALTDLERGITVNPGVIGGGSRSNVVPEEAWAKIDVRIAKAQDGEEIERALWEMQAEDPMCALTWSGEINRPPMERSDDTVRLFEEAQSLGQQFGITLREASTGGGSDGNFTAALGVPTLDGMGAVGEGAHAAHESLLLEELFPRTLLLAGMIATL